MLNVNAVGYFMNYCNSNMGKPGYCITQELLDQGISEILNSDEGRFCKCNCEDDVLKELGIL